MVWLPRIKTAFGSKDTWFLCSLSQVQSTADDSPWLHILNTVSVFSGENLSVVFLSLTLCGFWSALPLLLCLRLHHPTRHRLPTGFRARCQYLQVRRHFHAIGCLPDLLLTILLASHCRPDLLPADGNPVATAARPADYMECKAFSIYFSIIACIILASVIEKTSHGFNIFLGKKKRTSFSPSQTGLSRQPCFREVLKTFANTSNMFSIWALQYLCIGLVKLRVIIPIGI